jgi:hypothetical protein
MDPGLSVLLAGIAAEAEGRQVAEVACAAVGAAALAAGDAAEGEPCPPSAHQDPAGYVLRWGWAAASQELHDLYGLVNVALAHALGDGLAQALVGGGGGLGAWGDPGAVGASAGAGGDRGWHWWGRSPAAMPCPPSSSQPSLAGRHHTLSVRRLY